MRIGGEPHARGVDREEGTFAFGLEQTAGLDLGEGGADDGGAQVAGLVEQSLVDRLNALTHLGGENPSFTAIGKEAQARGAGAGIGHGGEQIRFEAIERFGSEEAAKGQLKNAAGGVEAEVVDG